eukprot:COSAG01_NODE_2633_length_7333_cov_89.156760_6_plen_75_part_00
MQEGSSQHGGQQVAYDSQEHSLEIANTAYSCGIPTITRGAACLRLSAQISTIILGPLANRHTKHTCHWGTALLS